MAPSVSYSEHTNRDGYAGDLAGALRGADVFFGLPAPHILTAAVRHAATAELDR